MSRNKIALLKSSLYGDILPWRFGGFSDAVAIGSDGFILRPAAITPLPARDPIPLTGSQQLINCLIRSNLAEKIAPYRSVENVNATIASRRLR